MGKRSVLVIGAGPTGMTAAIELQRAGFDVRIIDKSTHLAQHSQALVVQARTLEQFQRYGIADRAVERGRKLHSVDFRSEGKQILSMTFDKIPSRFPFLLMLPQSETEQILNERMESLGVRTERGVELLSLTQPENLVTARIRHPDGREEELHPDWVIGCDGAHSAVRELAEIPFEGKGISLSFFLSDAVCEGPDVPVNELALHLHQGNVVFMAPLPGNITRLIVATHEQQSKELHRDVTIEDFQQVIDKTGVRARIRSSEWMTPFHVRDMQAKYYRAGSIFLAGDASHIHSPVGGQGMNTGIQDTANLVWKLAAVARGADDSLLNSYEEERGAVGKALLRFTERGLKIATSSNPLFEAARDALMPIVSNMRPVQKAMLGFISETAIEYRSSSIVTDHGGDGELHAGDRLPDFNIEGSSLLAGWTEASHLVLVVGPSADEEGAGRLGAALPHAQVMDVPASALDDEGRRLLGTEDKLLIVRPDGYIGFRGKLDDQAHWQEYARQVAIA